MKWRKVLIVVIVAFFAVALIWWRPSKPPAKVIPFGTVTLPKPIDQILVSKGSKQEVLFFATEYGQGWGVKIRDHKLICKRAPITNSVSVYSGLFDMDKDGYPEFFHSDSEISTFWVFKRKESVKGRSIKFHPPPPNFPLPNRYDWVEWSQIFVEHSPLITFITDPDPKQPKKVVLWIADDPPSGYLYVLSQDGQDLIPFNSGALDNLDLWQGIRDVEDLDHDGICEIVLEGTYGIVLGNIGIYKWDGRTYRLWWISQSGEEDADDVELYDIDDDGTKEIVAVLDFSKDSNLHALVIYKLKNGRFCKTIQHPLPKGTASSDFTLLNILPMTKGKVIVLRQDNRLLFYLYQHRKLHRIGTMVWNADLTRINGIEGTTDIFACKVLLRSFPDWLRENIFLLPSAIQDWINRNLIWNRAKTLVLSFDGDQIYARQIWHGELEDTGKVGDKIWALITLRLSGKPSLYRYRLLFGSNGRYRVIWQSDFPESYTCAADLDGDSNDEMIFVTGRKIRVFKVIPK